MKNYKEFVNEVKMRRYNLWLDDLRNPTLIQPNTIKAWKDNFFRDLNLELKWAKSFDEFVYIINEFGLPHQISFDNDLGLEFENGIEKRNRKDGIACAVFLFEYCIENDLEMPIITIQSSNTIAKKEIYNICINDWKQYKNSLI